MGTQNLYTGFFQNLSSPKSRADVPGVTARASPMLDTNECPRRMESTGFGKTPRKACLLSITVRRGREWPYSMNDAPVSPGRGFSTEGLYRDNGRNRISTRAIASDFERT
jgi:hypothetical protein